jgi:hypothetical protein
VSIAKSPTQSKSSILFGPDFRVEEIFLFAGALINLFYFNCLSGGETTYLNLILQSSQTLLSTQGGFDYFDFWILFYLS